MEDDREVFIGGRDGLGALIEQSVGKKAGWNRQTEPRGVKASLAYSQRHLYFVLSHLSSMMAPTRMPSHQSRTNENLRSDSQIPSVRLHVKSRPARPPQDLATDASPQPMRRNLLKFFRH
jgi:hypothetical protein